MEAWVQRSVDWRETPMRLLTGFSIIGLLLASIGVYGVLAYYVSQRTREIGVRAALGATGRQLATLVVRQSLLPILAGVIAGVAGSFMSGRLLQQFLFQVQPGDSQVIACDRRVADCGRPARELDPRSPCGLHRPDGGVAGRINDDLAIEDLTTVWLMSSCQW